MKYRSENAYGGGLAAITSKKLRHMRFAAEVYGARYITEKDLRLAVVAIGAGEVMKLLEIE